MIPEFNRENPIWFHHHGRKMRVEKLDIENQLLIISGSAAKVTITGKDTHGYYVEWEIKYSPDELVIGRVYLKFVDIEAAFGLKNSTGQFGEWLLNSYGGDSADQGKYIRYKNFLNIPCPGTSNDGDPNISVDIDEEMKDAVKKLLAAKRIIKHICPECSVEGVVGGDDNFKCKECGFEQHLLFRKELMDLNDRHEGALAVEIAGESLMKQN
jgi:hypothetical protein